MLYRAKAIARKCRKLGVENRFVAWDFIKIKRKQGGKCFYCGRREEECGALTMDHVVPLVRGGGHVPENIVAACLSCNASKSDRSVWEFASVFRLRGFTATSEFVRLCRGHQLEMAI